jgi:predicted GTPase
MLKENGNIVLTVPAHMWLWNRDDTIAGHKIRYTKKDLENKLRENFDFEGTPIKLEFKNKHN